MPKFLHTVLENDDSDGIRVRHKTPIIIIMITIRWEMR